MDFLESELTEPFARLSPEDAAALLEERYGVPDPTLSRLETEKDDSFRVRSAVGDFVLKVAHPADDPLVINLQTAALAHASDVDASLPLQRLLPTLDGEIEPVMTGADGRERVIRVLTWLPGTMLRDATPTPERLRALGGTQARLARALEDFRHPAAVRELTWDVARLPALRPLLSLAPDLTPWLDRAEEIAPAVARLPWQVVHNDMNLDNIVTDADSPAFVTGILDFGDTVHTARAVDLAVSLSYLLPVGAAASLTAAETADSDANAASAAGASEYAASAVGSWAAVLPLVEGYNRENPLTAGELDLLFDLVIGRLVQRILVASWLADTVPENADYTGRNIALSRAQLSTLSAVGAERARAELCEVLGR